MRILCWHCCDSCVDGYVSLTPLLQALTAIREDRATASNIEDALCHVDELYSRTNAEWVLNKYHDLGQFELPKKDKNKDNKDKEDKDKGDNKAINKSQEKKEEDSTNALEDALEKKELSSAGREELTQRLAALAEQMHAVNSALQAKQ